MLPCNDTYAERLAFFVRLALFSLPLYVLSLVQIPLSGAQSFIALVSHKALLGLGIAATRNDLILSIPIEHGSWGAVITADCVGWKVMLFFAALVFATPCSLHKKARGLLLVGVLFLANLARIVFLLAYVAWFDLAHFAVLHAVLWSWGLIIWSIALWYIWLRKL